MTTALAFRARRSFMLNGREVEHGEVIDVSCLPDARVHQMELAGFGMRVIAEPTSDAATPTRRKVRPVSVADAQEAPAVETGVHVDAETEVLGSPDNEPDRDDEE